MAFLAYFTTLNPMQTFKSAGTKYHAPEGTGAVDARFPKRGAIFTTLLILYLAPKYFNCSDKSNPLHPEFGKDGITFHLSLIHI